MLKAVRAFGIAAIFFLVGAAAVSGQAGEAVRIDPAIIEEAVEPGGTLESRVRVTNLSDSAKTFYLLTRDITSVLPNGQPVFAEEGVTEEHGLSAWIRLSQRNLTLQPGQSREVPFTVVVPQDAAPGGHFGGVFVSTEPSRVTEPGAGSGVAYQVGTILNLRLAGTAAEEARIREFRTDRGVYSSEEVNFTTKVENLGNVLVRPLGPLEIENMWGRKVASLVVNSDKAGIFPGNDREFQVSWQPEGLAFGRYQALLALAYGEEGRKTITSSVSFWILPLNLILPVVGGLLLLLVGGYLLLRWYVRRKLRELGGPAAAPAPASAPVSRLLFVTVATLTFTLVFLVALFVFFS